MPHRYNECLSSQDRNYSKEQCVNAIKPSLTKDACTLNKRTTKNSTVELIASNKE